MLYNLAFKLCTDCLVFLEYMNFSVFEFLYIELYHGLLNFIRDSLKNLLCSVFYTTGISARTKNKPQNLLLSITRTATSATSFPNTSDPE